VASAVGPVSYERLVRAEAEPANWLMYSGNYGAHRYSALDQISTSNVQLLRLKWIYQMKTTHHVETTPLVVDGIMYATRPPSDVVALDARTGRKFWEFNYPAPVDVYTCCGLVNRGLAILGDRLFMATIDAHVVALDAKSGRLLWKVKQADYQAGYSGTVAPLVVKDKVIVGIAGGENGIRGFVDAFDAATGKRAWRFYTIPGPDDPHFGTWESDSWKTGGGATWVTGSYDPDLNLIYWGVGNPGPDWNDDYRAGDNLYTDSMVAIDADTGNLKWYFQYTPHDTHDWDSTQIPVLADLAIRSRRRKVLILPNRNGFYYVLDRATGEFLLAKQYVETQTWTKGIDDKGRPILLGDNRPTEVGVATWPGTDGGMSWYSPSFNPKTGLLYIPSREKSVVYYKTQAVYRPGLSFSGGGTMDNPSDPGYGLIMAMQPETGDIKWRHKTITAMRSGLLSTAGNLVFGSTMEGNFFALDARTGKDLWHFPGNDVSYASPMSYLSDGKQYVAVPIGDVLMVFGLD
jgi:alcohol dehydrogenase (cytochrome c)